MPGVSRVGDLSNCSADAHGCPACPHPVTGPAIVGSPNVFANGMPVLRVGDFGIHAVCCGPNMWTATKGSATVFVNGMQVHRLGDMDTHCGGVGNMIQGSPTVMAGG